MPALNPQGLIDNRVNAIRAYHKEVGLPRAEIDVSGGVDSAVVLGLLVKALGPENITAVYQGIHSSGSSTLRARESADKNGVFLIEIHLDSIFEGLIWAMKQSVPPGEAKAIGARMDADPTILGSLRSCLRAPIGRGFNRMMGGGIRHGTGNEDEDRWMRFYQKGGDGEVDTNPIAFLSKGEVWQLALALGVPKSILEASPSPDLWGVGETAHNDEGEIKTYLGLPKDCPYPMYSYVDFETGKYKNVGLIERVSRFLDGTWSIPNCWITSGEKLLFDDLEPRADELRAVAVDSGLFKDIGKTEFHGVTTLTALAIGPAEAEQIDKITGHLKLL